MGDTKTSSNSTPYDLKDLEVRLQGLSHNTDTSKIIESFAKSLGKTRKRQEVFDK